MNIDLEKHWYTKSLLSTLLLPLSWLFRITVALRRSFYSVFEPKKKANTPFVIVVGNISVGGTGKTPFVIWLARQCKLKRLRVGIILRGYKRANEKQVIEVKPLLSTVEEVGDEAILLALKTSSPVVVSADRNKAIEKLSSRYQVDVVLADDGLQHYPLARDAEIAIIDSERMHGNARLLPAGPLREPVSRLKSCDIVISNGKVDKQPYYFETTYAELVSVASDTIRKPITDFKSFKVHAVAGIGNPNRFFNILQAAGINVMKHGFEDHHAFTQEDLTFNDDEAIIMTEKDVVKCRKIAHKIVTSKGVWYLPIEINPNTALLKRVDSLLERIPHG